MENITLNLTSKALGQQFVCRDGEHVTIDQWEEGCEQGMPARCSRGFWHYPDGRTFKRLGSEDGFDIVCPVEGQGLDGSAK